MQKKYFPFEQAPGLWIVVRTDGSQFTESVFETRKEAEAFLSQLFTNARELVAEFNRNKS